MSDKNQVETTGHVWDDDLEEFNNPLPRWWVWIFYATIVWGIWYCFAYPSIPLKEGSTQGYTGYTIRGAVADEIQSFVDMNAELEAELASVDLTTLEQGSDLHNYALQSGKATFATWCSQCHGSGANGIEEGSGYPNLLDDDWLWGGDIENIHYSINYGIRSSSEDTRLGDMPAHDWLDETQADQIAEFVLSLSDSGSDAAAAEAGAVLFEEEGCSGCHGEGGEGMVDLGAPNLADALWLFSDGPDKASIVGTIMNGRASEMPTWEGRLTASQIAGVAAYVHSLGGGE
jgi:cytochrome c oxidase cbb3-type subunit 3